MRVRRETKGRKGKTVTTITGVPLDEDALRDLAGELKRRREALRSRGDYIEKILANATTGVVSLDAAGRVATANPAAAQLLGRDEPIPHGTDLGAMLGRDEELASLKSYLETAPRSGGQGSELRIGPHGGKRRQCDDQNSCSCGSRHSHSLLGCRWLCC